MARGLHIGYGSAFSQHLKNRVAGHQVYQQENQRDHQPDDGQGVQHRRARYRGIRPCFSATYIVELVMSDLKLEIQILCFTSAFSYFPVFSLRFGGRLGTPVFRFLPWRCGGLPSPDRKRWPSYSKLSPCLGNFLQAGEDESGEGLEAGIARQNQLVLRFKVPNADRSFEQKASSFEQAPAAAGRYRIRLRFHPPSAPGHLRR